jgi:hypothetical protein
MLKALDAAMACAITLVPFSNASNSNTPTGPFQTMVPAFLSCSAKACAVLRANVQNQVIVFHVGLAALMVAGASAAKVLAVTTSVGMGTAAPRAFMASITAVASASKSGSARLLPIFNRQPA